MITIYYSICHSFVLWLLPTQVLILKLLLSINVDHQLNSLFLYVKKATWFIDSFTSAIRGRSSKKVAEISLFIESCKESWFSGTESIRDIDVKMNKKNEYYHFMNTLLKNLTNYSLYLKKKPFEDRKRLLTIFLKKMNNQIIKRRQNSENVFDQGVFLPQPSNELEDSSNFVC